MFHFFDKVFSRLSDRFNEINLVSLGLPFYIRYLVAIVWVYLAFLLKSVILPASNQGVFSIFYVAITLSAWLSGIGPAIFATLLSIFIVEYFFLIPEAIQFGRVTLSHYTILLIYVSEGILITFIVGFMHRYMLKQQEINRQLQISEGKFKHIYESDLLGVAFWNINGEFTEVNDECLRILGYTRKEFDNEPFNWVSNTPEEYRPADEYAIKELMQKNICTPFTKEFIRKDGSKTFVLIAATFLPDTQKEGLAYILDMDEEHQAEIQRELFLGFMSHELKNPFASIKAYLQLIAKHLRDKGEAKELQLFDKVDQKILLVTRMLDDMLDMTKIRAGKLEFIEQKFSVQKVLENVVEEMQRISSTHHITIQGNTLFQLVGDKARIGQVFINLISNAIKYSPKNPNITIIIDETATSVSIAIKDEGIGISQADQKTIFEPIQRAKSVRSRPYPGTGLGLYISYEIIKHYSGTIKLVSKVNKGSTFIVTLPKKVQK